MIIGSDGLEDAIEGIDAAILAGLTPIKINMVVLKGLNESQIKPMIQFAKERKAILWLIELEGKKETRSEPFCQRYHQDMAHLESCLGGCAIRTESRSTNHRVKYFIAQEVEVVRPMHNSEFCAHCHRLRITSDGFLKPCLLSSDGALDILSVMRAGSGDDEIEKAFSKAIKSRRPYWP